MLVAQGPPCRGLPRGHTARARSRPPRASDSAGVRGGRSDTKPLRYSVESATATSPFPGLTGAPVSLVPRPCSPSARPLSQKLVSQSRLAVHTPVTAAQAGASTVADVSVTRAQPLSSRKAQSPRDGAGTDGAVRRRRREQHPGSRGSARGVGRGRATALCGAVRATRRDTGRPVLAP